MSDLSALATLTAGQVTAIKRAICPYCRARLPSISTMTPPRDSKETHFIPDTEHREFVCLARPFIDRWYAEIECARTLAEEGRDLVGAADQDSRAEAV